MDAAKPPTAETGALRRIKQMFNFKKDAAAPKVKELQDPNVSSGPKYFNLFSKLGRTLSGKKVFKIGKPTFSGTKSCDKCANAQAPIKLIIVADGETGQLKLNIEPCGAATTAA